MDRPNVLLIYTDQQRWDTLREAGNPHVITPNLDGLARSGALFENAFCNNPVCMPSRHSMLSGRYPSTLGSTCNGVEMRRDVPCLHNLLKPYGYHTGQIGKLHFLNHSARDHREPHPSYGFDTMIISDEPGCYDDAYIKWVEEHDPDQVPKCRVALPPACEREQPFEAPPRDASHPYVFEGDEHLSHSAFVADETARYIRTRRNEPFFCIAGFYAPHAPLNPPKRFVDMYDPSTLPLPAIGEKEDPLGMKRGKFPDEHWRKVKAYYYALVTHIDDQVGRILAALDECGLRDDTLVIFTADHGEHLGDHGVFGKGHPHWDSCCHVPLLVSLPGRIPAGRRTEIIEQVDVLPAILDYCGVQIPSAAQGRSFRPLIEGREYQPHTSAYCEYKRPFGASWKSVRTHDHFYTTERSGKELLYDLRKDPNQISDVSADPAYRDALNAMRNELLRRWFDVQDEYPLRTASY